MSIKEQHNKLADRDLMRIVIVGHVDHGKSTLVGRLFYETDSLPDGKYEAIQAMCEKRGVAFEWAFLMDAFQAERDQGITIDVSQIWFQSQKRDYTIIDAPGHREFLKNMITGAAQAEAAVLVIDAEEGVQEQSRRHGYLLHLMGIPQVSVIVNKMDKVGYAQDRFDKIEKEYRDYLASIGVRPQFIIPASGREGDLITEASDNMPWYKGPSMVEALDAFERIAEPEDQPLRMPVQDVYKFDDRRIIAGRIESGQIRIGDQLIFSPSNKKARVKSIEYWSSHEDLPMLVSAETGTSVGFTLDEQIFVERGDLVSHAINAPHETDVFTARLFWLSDNDLTIGKRYKLKLGTGEISVRVEEIKKVIDTQDLGGSDATKVERHQVAEVVLRARKILALDDYTQLRRTGRFVLVEGYHIAGGGIISTEGHANQRELLMKQSKNITRVKHGVALEEREIINNHRGGVMWLTGLSGSGKSTLAVELERKLFDKGYQAYVIDGDNVRHGLNSNLGFTPEDRAENIRRIGELAALFADAGFIVLASFISPYAKDREGARAASKGRFHEVYVKADVETCESRDPKGLYKKARAGEIKEFTGISAPYEEPQNPDLLVDTNCREISDCLEELVEYVEENFSLKHIQKDHKIDFQI